MAQKRMFCNDVISSDNFLEMPDGSQNLYFHLSMKADDDGFVDKYKSIMRMLGKKEDDLKILIAKSFVIPFENGILVIRHWRLNNYIQKDRYKETVYKEQKELLSLDKSNVYELYTNCVPSIDKNSIDTNSSLNNNIYNYLENIYNRTISSIEVDKINNWLEDFTEDIIKHAIDLSVLNNKKNLSYVNGIIRNWKSNEYKTLEDIKANETKKQTEDKNQEELYDYDWINDDEIVKNKEEK